MNGDAATGRPRLLPQVPDTRCEPDRNPYTERDAVLVDLLALRVEAWFREARQRAAMWEPADCPAVRPVYWTGGAS